MAARPLSVVPRWRWWTGFGVIVLIGGGLSAVAYIEGLPDALGRNQFDKVMHFGMAGLLAFFLDGALGRRSLFTAFGRGVPLAAVMVLVPVALEEYVQGYALFRTSSLWDFVADVAGVAVFIPLSRRAAK